MVDSVSLPLNGSSPGAHAVEHAAQAEQVAAVIDGFAAGLLGGHVGGRADDRPRSASGCGRRRRRGPGRSRGS